MSCAAALATDYENSTVKVILPEAGCLKILENEIDRMEENLDSLRNFLLPGGSVLVSYCHIARCVCRRAERAVLRLNANEKSPEIVTKFLNRLSDYLFVLSRMISLELDNEEIKWQI